jgi:hypothetical protein
MKENLEAQKKDEFVLAYTDPLHGSHINIHSRVHREQSDFQDLWEVSTDKARECYCSVDIMPIVSVNDKLYSLLFQGAKERKCPDICVDGNFISIKSPTLPLTDNKISKSIGNAHSQSNHVVILLPAKYNSYRLGQIVNGRFNTHEDLLTIEIKMDGKYLVYKR